MAEKPMKTIKTDKQTYELYVEQGLWKPKTNVKFNIGISGFVEADVRVKGRKSLVPAKIIITNYFPYNPDNYRR